MSNNLLGQLQELHSLQSVVYMCCFEICMQCKMAIPLKNKGVSQLGQVFPGKDGEWQIKGLFVWN